MNPCIRHGCHRCCLKTEMMLTEEDVKRIESLGHKDFYVEKDGFLILRNIDERCVFLGEDGMCIIYENRPKGCGYYPFVFDVFSGKMLLDAECPYKMEFAGPSLRNMKDLVDTIIRERLLRTSKPRI